MVSKKMPAQHTEQNLKEKQQTAKVTFQLLGYCQCDWNRVFNLIRMEFRNNGINSELGRKMLQGSWGDFIRLAVTGIWTVWLMISYFFEYSHWLPMLCYTLIAAIITARQRIFPNATAGALFAVTVDMVFLSYVTHLFGSIHSLIAVYYILVMIGYHTQESHPIRLTALLMAIFGYGTILGLEQTGVLKYYTDFQVSAPIPPVSDSVRAFFKISVALGGSYLFLSISSRKIEQHIRREAELIEENRRADETTRELQKQIESAQRLESLGRLAGGVAHDFNNLLTGILGYASFLREQLKDNADGRRDVDQLILAARQAATLTGQLLTFGRKQIVRPKIINLNEIITEATSGIKALLGGHHKLVCRLDADLGNIKADARQIEQVLQILTANARDAMSDGGCLTIQTENVRLPPQHTMEVPYLTAGEYIQLSVRDTGHGILPEYMDKIFDPFFTTRQREHGMGLGLSSAYGIIRQAAGHIDISSEVGAGTRVRMLFPQVFETVSPVTAPQPILSGCKETILLVEDEEMVRTSVSRILKRQNYHVLEASNGEDAIQLFNSSANKINLVLTDVIMTGMTGETLAQQIQLKHPDIPVLFMSGYTEDAITNSGILKEGTAFIAKPFHATDLLQAVAKTLKSSN